MMKNKLTIALDNEKLYHTTVRQNCIKMLIWISSYEMRPHPSLSGNTSQDFLVGQRSLPSRFVGTNRGLQRTYTCRWYCGNTSRMYVVPDTISVKSEKKMLFYILEVDLKIVSMFTYE